MIIFRWGIGTIFALLAAASVLSLLLFLALDIPLWLKRARSLRRGAYLAGLTWFNVEIWGRIVFALILG